VFCVFFALKCESKIYPLISETSCIIEAYFYFTNTLYSRGVLWIANRNTLYSRGLLWVANRNALYSRGVLWVANKNTLYSRGVLWVANRNTLYSRGVLWVANIHSSQKTHTFMSPYLTVHHVITKARYLTVLWGSSGRFACPSPNTVKSFSSYSVFILVILCLLSLLGQRNC
jgi:hypothetical protein